MSLFFHANKYCTNYKLARLLHAVKFPAAPQGKRNPAERKSPPGSIVLNQNSLAQSTSQIAIEAPSVPLKAPVPWVKSLVYPSEASTLKPSCR